MRIGLSILVLILAAPPAFARLADTVWDVQARPTVVRYSINGKPGREVLSPNERSRWPDRYAFHADGRFEEVGFGWTGEWVQRGRKYVVHLTPDLTPSSALPWENHTIQILQADITGIEKRGVLTIKLVTRWVERGVRNGRPQVARIVAKMTGRAVLRPDVPIDGDLVWKSGVRPPNIDRRFPFESKPD